MVVRIAALALAVALVSPAAAQAPAPGWYPGDGVEGTLTVVRTGYGTRAIAGGLGGVVLHSTDSGASWRRLTAPGASDIRDVAALHDAALFVLDATGVLKRSTDGGGTWHQLSTRPALALTVSSPGKVLLASGRRLQLSTDGGDTFTDVTPRLAPWERLRGLDRAEGERTLVAYGPRTLLVAGPSARGWRHLRLPRFARGETITAADFMRARRGFVLSSLRRVYRTRDAGHDWQELLGTGGAGADLAFSDRSHGFVAAPGLASRYDGVVLITSDGGDSWRPQRVAPRFLSRVAAGDARAYAIANEGSSLLATQSGGAQDAGVLLSLRASAKRVRRGHSVTVRGRVSPAAGVREVLISVRSAGRWQTRVAEVAGDGTYRSRFRLQRTTAFVAQVLGDSRQRGAGTQPVFVRVTR